MLMHKHTQSAMLKCNTYYCSLRHHLSSRLITCSLGSECKPRHYNKINFKDNDIQTKNKLPVELRGVGSGASSSLSLSLIVVHESFCLNTQC